MTGSTPGTNIGGRSFGPNQLFIIAGPCVIEDGEMPLAIAARLGEISQKLDLPIIFKASFDKANRTSLKSFRGPGLDAGLPILAQVREESGLPLLSDIHMPEQAAPAGEVLDVIQIPAFLCRQTDLLAAAARTGRPVNVKKGQMLAPGDMVNVLGKLRDSGAATVWLTERGASFGYNNLVVDLRSIPIMAEMGALVVFDATHSVQLPGGQGKSSGGERSFVPPLARAAVAAGAHGVFLEVHPDPDRALCDGPNSWPLDQLEELLQRLQDVYNLVNQ